MATLLAPQDSTNMSQAQWQEMFQGLFSNGVISGQLNAFAVTTTSGLGISVASGKAMLQGFMGRSDAAVALTAAAADPSNPRIDRAVLHADLTAHTLAVQLLTGTPSPSPIPPNLTQTSTVWEISLSQVRVNAGAVTISSLTDERAFSLATIPSGAIVDAMMANAKVNRGGDTMSGNLTLPQIIFNAALSAGTKLIDLLQGYGIFSDNTATTGTTRSWWNGPDRGEAHIGPRTGVDYFDLVRFIATRVTVKLGKNGSTNPLAFEVLGGPTQLDTGTITTDGAGNLAATSLKEGTTRVAVQGTHSAGQPKISYGTGVPGTLDANEIYFQIS